MEKTVKKARESVPLRVLLTGGSGFIALHILHILLAHGHSVVATVRSDESAEKVRNSHPGLPSSKLDIAIVKDVASEHAFEEVVKYSPPFQAVVHTASPYHYNSDNVKTDLIDPAILGTVGILKAIKKYAPSVEKVVITSSFVSVMDESQGVCWDHTYTAEDWNPITMEDACGNPRKGYQAGKTFAEKEAWKFMQNEKPTFTLCTICPPLVFGPVKNSSSSLDSLNTSSQRIFNLMSGKCRQQIPDTAFYLWVDVRDLALAHVRAAEAANMESQRFLPIAGYFNNREISRIIREAFPSLAESLPTAQTPGGGYPEERLYRFDNQLVRDKLGIEFRPLNRSIIDFVQSLNSISV